jgi:hypothetical protein
LQTKDVNLQEHTKNQFRTFSNKMISYFIKLLGQKMSHRIRHFLRRSLRERMFDNSRSEMFEKLYDGSRRKVRHDPRKRLPNSL